MEGGIGRVLGKQRKRVFFKRRERVAFWKLAGP